MTTSAATPIESSTRTNVPPTRSTLASGRNPAITRSSITRTARTNGVSRLPIHPSSSSMRAITPEEEM